MIPSEEQHSEPQNINISAYRVLYILSLLIQHQSLNMLTLNNFLWENPLIRRTYNRETLTKYIKTLRGVGCKINRPTKRNKFNYELMQNPLPILPEEEELRVARQLLKLLASQPDEELHVQYYRVLQKIAWSIPSSLKEHLLLETEETITPPALQRRRELLKQYRKLCREALVLQVEYQSDTEEVEDFAVEPIQVLQQGQQFFLLGIHRKTYEKVKLNLEKIVTVRQLPSKVNTPIKQVNVIFELTGRLAATYRLYPDETIVFENPGVLRIKAKTGDYPSLLQRLLKYQDLCEVISPGYVRIEMQQMIENLLNHLN